MAEESKEEGEEDSLASIDKLARFFFNESVYQDQIITIFEEADENKHYGVEFHSMDLFQKNMELGRALFEQPEDFYRLATQALILTQEWLMAIPNGPDGTLKKHVHVRLRGLFSSPEDYRETVSSIRSSDCGKLVQMEGTVTRTGKKKILEYSKSYICKSCKHEWEVVAHIRDNFIVATPKRCPGNGADSRDGRRQRCKGRVFLEKEENRIVRDYQELRLQEQIHKLEIGRVPRHMKVFLMDDLVDKVTAGADVLLIGIVKCVWDMPVMPNELCKLTLVIEANNVLPLDKRGNEQAKVEQNNFLHIEEWRNHWVLHKDNPLLGRDKILRNVCPGLFGMKMIKLALTLSVLIGGNSIETDSGSKVRGNSHLLMVGDPGTGKSQLLRYVQKMVKRCVITNGVGSTSAGLTVACVKDSGEWVLEAGALVLADGGVCCIDEFGLINEGSADIHEAMEQQTISIAKAGLVCTLNTRCSVLGAMNPVGRFDQEATMASNCGIPTPLLSRFDVILVMLDIHDPEWDDMIADHVLNSVTQDEEGTQMVGHDMSNLPRVN